MSRANTRNVGMKNVAFFKKIQKKCEKENNDLARQFVSIVFLMWKELYTHGMIDTNFSKFVGNYSENAQKLSLIERQVV